MMLQEAYGEDTGYQESFLEVCVETDDCWNRET